MRLYSENNSYKLYNGNMLDMLEVIEPNSIDAVITDPPYELGFMGKSWDDSGIAFQKSTWHKCYEVLKDGGYLLAFGGTRTFHRIACAIEDAGFEIRDTIMWLYGSGFPKSMNVGLAIDKKNGVDNRTGKLIKGGDMLGIMNDDSWQPKEFIEERKATNEWAGWGTCLKPAYEPIIVARKPFKGSLVDNVLANGVGGLNIDECRVGNEHFEIEDGEYDNNLNQSCYGNVKRTPKSYDGRFPANVILTYDETDEQEVCGGMPNCKSTKTLGDDNRYIVNKESFLRGGHNEFNSYDDDGSAARYFYCAKASKRDRDAGLDAFEKLTVSDGRIKPIDNAFNRGETLRRNIHPTVKPVDLMQYLIRLVCPKGATILDPFNGSGSTGKAVMYENNDHNKDYKYIGIELTDEYLPISKARIECAYYDKERLDSKVVDKVDNVVYENATLFDLLGA